MSVIQGKTSTLYSLNESGLFGKRYVGYFADDVKWWDTAQLQGQTNLTTNITSFTSGGDFYSWQWMGYFRPNVTGTWTFYTTSDDASYLWIGNTSVIGYTTSNALVNNGGLHPSIKTSGTISLNADIYYPIRIMFGELTGGDVMSVSFTPPGGIETGDGLGYYFGGRYAWDAIIGR